ncbi:MULTISPECIES: oxidoreductase [Streptomyces]|uniref:KR domain-containing protein n=1 Tax=Streptomyces tsukubensis (strain DSM 42081 / NBRC 108919 / NRRL 18488 / 9993) TaxID=1114943 RepID=A0A7G3U6N8_STRT9|nr:MULTISPECIES: oxidoreductase [Streptomyces]MYS64434.1 SDR family NAD(P)-dependent oxidoreductase [Streptomyces sp. SID5473]QKM66084.1 KR domain-containing protein [Streptomyces tsukubensis NRRL18488]TAI42366.1 SDR family NAD(P)-dependent oxidoreductase [Streptomyces tsukubensis]
MTTALHTAPGEWNIADIPDQSGRTAVVTGGNSGIGLATVRALAAAGAHVVLAVRDPEGGEAAAADVDGSVEVRRVDLADLASVREFAAGWRGTLDVLVNNAGVMNTSESRTKDGFETQFGTNHLGHFALTNLLLPHITDRVVTVSSEAHKKPGAPRIHFDNLGLAGEYRPRAAYSQSKLANLLFTLELQRRLAAARSSVRALAAHPGWAATNLQRHGWGALSRAVMRIVAQDSRAGALPTLYAAVQDLPGASYVGPDGRGEIRGRPTLVGRSAAASDPVAARRLWAVSEELTGVTFPEPAPIAT